ncbi:MAG: 16S rRNA (guanine(527)-N(7))-methyltransferase RsmG [Bacteroidota bacterium]
MEKILEYFPKLSERQIQQFEQLGTLYREWNEQINVISRKDIEHLYDHHILHSLGLAKVVHFKSGSNILDLGTGGGLPGIPLAILLPKVKFKLVDGRGKKIKVVNAIAETLGLDNVEGQHIRAEELKERFDFIVCRGVTSLDRLCVWSKKLLGARESNAIPNGLLALKGGNIKKEVKLLPKGEYAEIVKLTDYFKEEWFIEKYVVYVQR